MQVTLNNDGTPVRRLLIEASTADQILIDAGGVSQLKAALDVIDGDDACRVIVLESPAGVFCEGMDIRSLSGDEVDSAQWVQAFADCLQRLAESPRPVIAAVDGKAQGGGVALAAAADIVIATDRSAFALPEAVLGLLPALVMPILHQRLTRQRVRLFALSSSIDTKTATTWGLVDRHVDDSERLERALRLQIKHLLRCSPAALADLMSLEAREAGLDLAAALEAGAAYTAERVSHREHLDQLAAFREGEPLPWFDRYRPPKPKEEDR